MSFLTDLTSKLALPDEHATHRETIAVSMLYAVLAVGVTAIVIHGAYFGSITALILRSTFFSMAAAAGLLAVAVQTRARWARLALYMLAFIALVPGPPLRASYCDILMRGALSPGSDHVLFLGLAAVTLVLVRRTLGWALLILAVISLLYASFGYL